MPEQPDAASGHGLTPVFQASTPNYGDLPISLAVRASIKVSTGQFSQCDQWFFSFHP
jgi:hypothetical protein